MRKISNVILCFIMLVIFNSCKHDNFKDFVGPSICPSKSFAFKSQFAVSSSSVDFTINIADTITASFTEVVSWTVTITGKTSGAKTTITGKSDTLGIIWQGNPTRGNSEGDYRFFKTGEDVTIALSIPCQELQTKTVHIAKENDFSATAGGIILATDFEGTPSLHNGYLPDSTHIGYNGLGWSAYASGTISKFHIVSSPLTAPQGSHYVTFQGTAKNWYLGDFEANAPTNFTDANPNNNYLNAFVNSGNNKTTALTVALKASGILYSKTFNIDWTGWKYISYKFSDFKDPSGNSLSNVTSVAYVIFATGPSTAINQDNEVNVDMIVFTKGGPFIQ